MIELQIILEGAVAEKLQAIAERLGLGLVIVVVMACQKYIRWVDQRGLPPITGVKLGTQLRDE